ncbi:MAG: hypothetical protein ACYTE3_08135 [Planctomycetota bacterium]|jgi:hypothetical protein
MNEWIFENGDNQTQKAEEPASLKDKTELAVLTDRVKTNHRQLKESLDRLQNSLDNLRLVTKYRVFDLEATRRENARLRKLLEGDDDREIP